MFIRLKHTADMPSKQTAYKQQCSDTSLPLACSSLPANLFSPFKAAVGSCTTVTIMTVIEVNYSWLLALLAALIPRQS